ncbi:MAG: methyltransferase domain-containing protein [Chlamydiae bacterium]|nr:methyltransferase domain-containing protein [Chlamydiota bacterium]MBI3265822.1 methyltransferase domain-containing protein [Chlamydiota bacterium]
MKFVPKQSHDPEWMDGDDYTEEDLEKTLKNLQWINCWLGGTRVILKNLEREIQKRGLKKFSILDVGTGSGDIPIQIIKWARKNPYQVSILALDKNPRMVKMAKRNAALYPEISVQIQDVFDLKESEQKFDFCISSLFLHHLSPDQAIPILKKMLSLSRCGVLINDLLRAWIPYGFYQILSGVMCFHAMTRNDGAISILRAFTVQELKTLMKSNGFKNYEVRRHFPYRLSLWIF